MIKLIRRVRNVDSSIGHVSALGPVGGDSLAVLAAGSSADGEGTYFLARLDSRHFLFLILLQDIYPSENDIIEHLHSVRFGIVSDIRGDYHHIALGRTYLGICFGAIPIDSRTPGIGKRLGFGGVRRVHEQGITFLNQFR